MQIIPDSTYPSGTVSRKERISLVILFFILIIVKYLCTSFLVISYDEAAYAATAARLAHEGGWFNLYGSRDLFFFPPLFNYFSGILVTLGFDRILAVRTVTIFLSSGIPVLLYILMRKNKFDITISAITVVFWLTSSYSLYFSILGQVETPMLFFILLCLYFLQTGIERPVWIWRILFSALCLCAAIWIKETAIGFIPVFLILLYPSWRKGAVFAGVTGIGILPLIAQNFLPHHYSLFYELTSDKISWDFTLHINELIYNFFLLIGILPAPHIFLNYLVILFFGLVTLIVLVSQAQQLYRQSLIHRFAALTLIIYLPFFDIFPKRLVYYLLPVFLCYIIYVTPFLTKKIWIGLIFFFLLLSMAFFGSFENFDSETADGYEKILTAVSQKKQNAVIAMSLPMISDYYREKHNIPVTIIDVSEESDIRQVSPLDIIRSADFYMGDDYFFYSLFCKKWPHMKQAQCDKEAFEKAKEDLRFLGEWKGMKLYEVIGR